MLRHKIVVLAKFGISAGLITLVLVKADLSGVLDDPVELSGVVQSLGRQEYDVAL